MNLINPNLAQYVTFSVSSSILPPSESHGDMKNDLKKYVKNYGRV